jgi:hypothetical protein
MNMSWLELIAHESVCLLGIWALWAGLKIRRTYGNYMDRAIDFAFEGDDWRIKSIWCRSLTQHATIAIWHPFRTPKDAIQGHYRAEFFRWLEARKQDAQLIDTATRELV